MLSYFLNRSKPASLYYIGLLTSLLMMSTLQVEMERSYLTAEVFREILQQNGRSNENGEVIRTLSGRQVQWHPCLCR